MKRLVTPEGEAALTDVGSLVDRLRTRSAEFAGAVDQLQASGTGNMVPLMKSSVVRQVLRASTQVQMQASLGAEAEPENPMFAGGLVASSDGLSWVPAQEG